MTMNDVSCLIVFGLICCCVGILLGGLASEMHHFFDCFGEEDEE